MLHHDLYILSLYFTPEHAVMYEDEVLRRYSRMDIAALVEKGLIKVGRLSGFFGTGRHIFYRLTPQGQLAAGREVS